MRPRVLSSQVQLAIAVMTPLLGIDEALDDALADNPDGVDAWDELDAMATVDDSDKAKADALAGLVQLLLELRKSEVTGSPTPRATIQEIGRRAASEEFL